MTLLTPDARLENVDTVRKFALASCGLDFIGKYNHVPEKYRKSRPGHTRVYM